MRKKMAENGQFYTLGSVALIVLCIGMYLLNRSVVVKSNDLLITYETRAARTVTEETIGDIDYKTYAFGEDVGTVIATKDNVEVTLRDNKRGFIKSYRYGVLYLVDDYKKEEMVAKFKSYLNPRFWFSGSREVREVMNPPFRSLEECHRLGQLLKDKKYDLIKQDKKNSIVFTQKGTAFVN